jgi:hypothetical protein
MSKTTWDDVVTAREGLSFWLHWREAWLQEAGGGANGQLWLRYAGDSAPRASSAFFQEVIVTASREARALNELRSREYTLLHLLDPNYDNYRRLVYEQGHLARDLLHSGAIFGTRYCRRETGNGPAPPP